MSLRAKEEELSSLEVEDEIASRKMSIAQKRAVEAEMRKKYGRNWKKILNIRVKPENMQEMRALGAELRSLSKPRMTRISGRRSEQ